GRDQHFCDLSERVGIAYRLRTLPELRNDQLAPRFELFFLLIGIDDNEHRSHRRGRREIVSAYSAFGEVLQVSGLIVPFDVVADDNRLIVRAMRPLHARTELRAL